MSTTFADLEREYRTLTDQMERKFSDYQAKYYAVEMPKLEAKLPPMPIEPSLPSVCRPPLRPCRLPSREELDSYFDEEEANAYIPSALPSRYYYTSQEHMQREQEIAEWDRLYAADAEVWDAYDQVQSVYHAQIISRSHVRERAMYELKESMNKEINQDREYAALKTQCRIIWQPIQDYKDAIVKIRARLERMRSDTNDLMPGVKRNKLLLINRASFAIYRAGQRYGNHQIIEAILEKLANDLNDAEYRFTRLFAKYGRQYGEVKSLMVSARLLLEPLSSDSDRMTSVIQEARAAAGLSDSPRSSTSPSSPITVGARALAAAKAVVEVDSQTIEPRPAPLASMP